MRVTIEAEEGELAQKLDRLVAQLQERADGHDHDLLCKAAGDDQPRELDTPALQGSIDRSKPLVEKIRKVMLRRLEATIRRAAG